MSPPETAADPFAGVASLPRSEAGPVFPAPWSARAFGLTVALQERGLFEWAEWSAVLGAKVAEATRENAGDPEAYWRGWLAALEELLASKAVATPADLIALQEAWREAAEHTPHGEPIELP